MKDFDGNIVLYNVNRMNTTILAKNTSQVSFFLVNILQNDYLNIKCSFYWSSFVFMTIFVSTSRSK